MHTMNRQCHLKLELLLTVRRIPSITTLSQEIHILELRKRGVTWEPFHKQTNHQSVTPPPPNFLP